MARGFVLIKYGGELDRGSDVLEHALHDPAVFRESGSILEAYHVALGAADFSALLYAPAMGAIYNGVRVLRERLDKSRHAGEMRTESSTIVGLEKEEWQFAFARALDIVRRRVEAVGDSRDPRVIKRAIHDVAIEAYLAERFRFLREFIVRCQDDGLLQDHTKDLEGLLGAMESFLKGGGRSDADVGS